MNATKKCNKCATQKDLSEFHKCSKHGVQSKCKDCVKIIAHEYNKLNKEKNKVRERKYRQENREKVNIAKSLYRQKNSEKYKQAQKKWCEENKDKVDAKRNRYMAKDSSKEKLKAYREANIGKYLNRAAIFRAGYASVKWANAHKCQEIYRQSVEVAKWTGLKYEVDHIIPLKGLDKNGVHVVCGLHNEYNLRIVTRMENKEKSNKFLEFV